MIKKLTAKQIEKVIHDCSSYASYDGVQYYANGIRMQAIADELNAMLDSGECCNLTGETDWFECSECGAEVSVEWCGSGYDVPNYCPKCGKKVKR